VDWFLKSNLFPDPLYIERAKMHQATFTWLVLPTPQDSKFFGPAPVVHNLPPALANVHDQPLPDFVALNDLVENSDDLPPPILD